MYLLGYNTVKFILMWKMCNSCKPGLCPREEIDCPGILNTKVRQTVFVTTWIRSAIGESYCGFGSRSMTQTFVTSINWMFITSLVICVYDYKSVTNTCRFLNAQIFLPTTKKSVAITVQEVWWQTDGRTAEPQ